jgi:hypothetical protein
VAPLILVTAIGPEQIPRRRHKATTNVAYMLSKNLKIAVETSFGLSC